MAIKYTICEISMIKLQFFLFFFYINLCKKMMKREQSKAQQQYV